MTIEHPSTIIAILAHNEERRIGQCIASLPEERDGLSVHVIVNGSRDNSADIARSTTRNDIVVHDWPEGGKARSWNRFIFDTPDIDADYYVFVDGDAEIIPNSVDALVAALEADVAANAAAGMPCNGRKVEAYRAELVRTHGLFGDLYALRGEFIDRMRKNHVRLPSDVVGDDGLIGSFAKTNLGQDEWRDERVIPVTTAGFLCEPVNLSSFAMLKLQYNRMINYSVRHFQSRIISAVMDGVGPHALPNPMADLYLLWLEKFKPRTDPVWWWFDHAALAKMHRQSRLDAE